MLVPLAVVVLLDVINYGVGVTSSDALTLLDSVNHCVAFRSAIGARRWWITIPSVVFLKRIAAWTSCIARGTAPNLSRDAYEVALVLVALMIVNVGYRTFLEPSTHLVLSIGGAIFRWRRLCLMVDTFDSSALDSWRIYAAVSLLVDGAAMARRTAAWATTTRHLGPVLPRAGAFAAKRIVPTLLLFTAIGTPSLRSTAVWVALCFYLYSYRVFHQTRHLLSVVTRTDEPTKEIISPTSNDDETTDEGSEVESDKDESGICEDAPKITSTDDAPVKSEVRHRKPMQEKDRARLLKS